MIVEHDGGAVLRPVLPVAGTDRSAPCARNTGGTAGGKGGDDSEADDVDVEEEEDVDIEDDGEESSGEESSGEEPEEDEEEEEGEGALLDVERKAQKLDRARCAAPRRTPSQQSLHLVLSAHVGLESIELYMYRGNRMAARLVKLMVRALDGHTMRGSSIMAARAAAAGARAARGRPAGAPALHEALTKGRRMRAWRGVRLAACAAWQHAPWAASHGTTARTQGSGRGGRRGGGGGGWCGAGRWRAGAI